MTDAQIKERFIALETKVAFQEKLLRDLDDVITQQDKNLDELLLKVTRMENAFREMSGEKPGHEPPPHY